MLNRILMAVVGVIVMLGFWTVKDKLFGDDSRQSAKQIPAQVWGGGAGKLTIEAEATEPASVVASFETDHTVDDKDHKFLEAWQEIAPGKHTMTIDVPAKVSCHLAVLFPDPKVAKAGSKLAITVKLNGKIVGQQTDVLEEALKDGYGMQVEVNLSDCAAGTVAKDD